MTLEKIEEFKFEEPIFRMKSEGINQMSSPLLFNKQPTEKNLQQYLQEEISSKVIDKKSHLSRNAVVSKFNKTTNFAPNYQSSMKIGADDL
jgi:predicted DNA-binding protein YlxM (UPF0122 family)